LMVVFVIGQSVWLGKHIQTDDTAGSGTPPGKP
jgi:intracellular septation protein